MTPEEFRAELEALPAKLQEQAQRVLLDEANRTRNQIAEAEAKVGGKPMLQVIPTPTGARLTARQLRGRVDPEALEARVGATVERRLRP